MDNDEKKWIYIGVGAALGVAVICITLGAVLIKYRRTRAISTASCRDEETEQTSSNETNNISTDGDALSDLSSLSAESGNYENKLDLQLDINEEDNSFTGSLPRTLTARNDSEHFAISATLRRSIISLQAVEDSTLPSVHLRQGSWTKSLPPSFRARQNQSIWNRYLFNLNSSRNDKTQVEEDTEAYRIRSLPDLHSEQITDSQQRSLLSIITV